MSTNSWLNNSSFEFMQIKNKTVERIADETKINEFIRNYFWVNEKQILNIYENLINFFFSIDELWKFKEDFKIFLEEEWWFLLDKLLAWYSIDDQKLYDFVFEKLNMKRDEFWNKWMYIFTRSVFQDWWVERLFNEVKNIKDNWKEQYIFWITQSLWLLIWQSVLKLIKNDIVKELQQQFENVSEKDIEENYWFVIEWLLNKRIIEKNFQTIINKFSEYFAIKWIDISMLIKWYDDFSSILQNMNYTTILSERKKALQKEWWVSKSFYKYIWNKNLLFLNTNAQNKQEIEKKLTFLLNQKKAKELITITEKMWFLQKQVIWTSIYFDLLLQEIWWLLQEYKIVLEKWYTKEQIIKKLEENKFNTNSFFWKLSNLFDWYTQSELDSKIDLLLQEPENFYDVNVLFDDLFQKISKIEDLWIYQDDWIFKLWTTEILQDILLTKYEKLDLIYQNYLFNKDVIDTLSWLYTNFDTIKYMYFKKLVEWKRKIVIDYLWFFLQEYEKIKLWVFRNQLNYNQFLNKTKFSEFIVHYSTFYWRWLNKYFNLNSINKKVAFIDYFFSPSSKEQVNQLMNFLKIFQLSEILHTEYENIEIYIWKNEYVNNLRKLYNLKNWPVVYKKFIKASKNNLDAKWKERLTLENIQKSVNKEFFKKFKKESKNSENITKRYLQQFTMSNKLWWIDQWMNSLTNLFFKYLEKNESSIDYCVNFEKYINNIEEIDMISWLYFLLNSTWTTIESHDDFVLVYYWNNIFVFFTNPWFNTMNNITLLLEQKKDTKHIFIYCHINFYLYLTWLFNKNINIKWIQQNFKQVLLLSYYDDEISDITLFWWKQSNFSYFLVRKKWKYQKVWFKRSESIQDSFWFWLIENCIENIISMWWSVSSEKQSDTSIRFWWINYRIWIVKDWDRVWIVMRKAQNSESWVDLKKFMDENWLVYMNRELTYKKESFWLYQTYDKEDVDLMLWYVMSTTWLICISWSTWSWKSVSMRNFLNHVYQSSLSKNIWRKISTFEDPIEAENRNFMQFNFKKNELPRAILAIKRIDLDDCLIWEIRDYEMLPWILEALDTVWCYTTMHSPTVWSALFLLKKWSTQSKVDLVDILYALKILMAQKLSFYLKDQYQNEEIRLQQAELWNIELIEKWSKQEIELFEKIKMLTIWTLWKDINYYVLKEKIQQKDSSVTDFQKSIIYTEELTEYILRQLIDKWILVYQFKENVVRRKVYYEMIDKVKIKLEFNILYSVLTWENVTGKELQEDELDINKLMIKILRKTREQRALEDFFRWRLWFNSLLEFSQEYLILVLRVMFIKNWVKDKKSADEFIEKLLNDWKIE